MGAWGIGPFDNDDAADWVYEVEDGGIATVRSALQAVADDDDPDSGVGAAAVAAAELVAAMAGSPSAGLSDEAAALLPSLGPADAALVAQAIAAVGAARSRGELAGLWEESDEHEAWLASLDDLTARLVGSSST